MFSLSKTDRLTEWKRIRDQIETDENPLKLVAEVWAAAPFVSPYLNPQTPAEWPDPWRLVMDMKLDDLAITLGMLYTIKLTQRFMATPCEIHKFMPSKDRDLNYILVVDNQLVLNYEPRIVHDLKTLPELQTNTVWRCEQLL